MTEEYIGENLGQENQPNALPEKKTLKEINDEIKKEADEVRRELKELLGLSETDERALVINRLKDNFWLDYQDCFKSYKAADQRFFEYLRRKGKEVDPSTISGGISEEHISLIGLGNIFEHLVLADRNISQMREHSLGRELRRFLLNPSVLSFALSHLGGIFAFKLPDQILVEKKTGLIRGIVECKVSSHLDQRSFEQLSPAGFRRSIRTAIEILNRISEECFLKGGFPAIARVRGKFKLSDDPIFILAVPAPKEGIQLSQEELKKRLLPVRFKDGTAIDPEIRDKVLAVLEDYTIKTSVFSKYDLININNYLLNRYKPK